MNFCPLKEFPNDVIKSKQGDYPASLIRPKQHRSQMFFFKRIYLSILQESIIPRRLSTSTFVRKNAFSNNPLSIKCSSDVRMSYTFLTLQLRICFFRANNADMLANSQIVRFHINLHQRKSHGHLC